MNKIIDLLPLIGLLAAVILTGVLSEFLGLKNILHPEIGRKVFHFTASICAALSVYLIPNKTLLIVIGFSTTFISFLLIKFNVLKSIHHSRSKSWGIFYLPLIYTVLLITLYPAEKQIIFFALIILGISDSLAAIAGSIFSEKHFNLTGDNKTVLGSSIFFVSTFILIVVAGDSFVRPGYHVLQQFSYTELLLFAFSVSILLTIIEAISSSGTDNFFVPIFSAVLFLVVKENPQNGFVFDLFTGVVLAGAVSLLSIKFKFLTPNGSAATFILAGIIFGLGGWKWSIPIMSFFILSSLLSKIRKRENEKVETYFEKTGTRDYLQVLANGGLGGVLVIYNQISYSELNYYIYLASLAAVCADTWATEIGTLRKRNTYNIVNFKKINQGISGGISLGGTLGALLGSIVIALSGVFWVSVDLVYYFLLLLLSGLFGSFFDSLLGATIQSQGKCEVCSAVTEKDIHCGKATQHYRGFKWLNNDAVNFFAGVSAAVFLLLIY